MAPPFPLSSIRPLVWRLKAIQSLHSQHKDKYCSFSVSMKHLVFHFESWQMTVTNGLMNLPYCPLWIWRWAKSKISVSFFGHAHLGLKGFCCILNNILLILKISPINKRASCKPHSYAAVDHFSLSTWQISFGGKCFSQLWHNYLKQGTYVEKLCKNKNKTTKWSFVLENNSNTSVSTMNSRPVFTTFLFYLKANNDICRWLQEYGIVCINL